MAEKRATSVSSTVESCRDVSRRDLSRQDLSSGDLSSGDLSSGDLSSGDSSSGDLSRGDLSVLVNRCSPMTRLRLMHHIAMYTRLFAQGLAIKHHPRIAPEIVPERQASPSCPA